MREMKDTPISGLTQIPKTWNIVPLKMLFSFRKGLSITKSDLTDEGIKVISYGQIHSKNCDGVHATNELIRFTANEFQSNNSLVKCGGFIFADTSEDLNGCGNAIYITDEVYGGYHTIVLNPKEAHDYRYLAYLFKTDAWRTELRKQLTEVKVFSITQFALKNMHVILPSNEEMIQIADFLDSKCSSIDQAVQKQKDIVDRLTEYKQSIITQAVTKGLNPDVEMKDSGVKFVGMIPVNWTVQRLKFCLSESLKYGANESGINYNENLPRYIRITDITEDGKLKEANKLSLTIEQANNYILKDKDILLARSGATVGKSFLYKKEYGIAAFAGYLIKATVNEKLLPEYFNYITQSSYYSLWKDWIFSQATIQNIGADKYNQLPTVIPSIEEQIDITNYLDNKCAKIAEAISRQMAAIGKLEEYKKSLIYNAVTGKIDCRNA